MGKGHVPGFAELGQHEHSWAISAPVRQQQTGGDGQHHIRSSDSISAGRGVQELQKRGRNEKYTQSCDQENFSCCNSMHSYKGCFTLNTSAGKRSSLQVEVSLATVTDEKMPQCGIMVHTGG